MVRDILLTKTSKDWASAVLKDFDLFLLDHAACERKAAALAMSFVVKYPDRSKLILPMVSLAREELLHFNQVYRILEKKNLTLPPKDYKDSYVNDIISQLRHGRDERFLDRLITSAMIEARGHERLHIIAEAIEDEQLSTFYKRLAKEEEGHYKVFINIARQYFDDDVVEKRQDELLLVEKEACEKTPITFKLH
ncbi:MAG: tRNA-(ms[2]io[6]A)-hydroxylase [Zetaproteobacteria bacterium]|nr:tRNA-(ms[2]io[6]A)-hydroxylase [Pseudobdellovibrionaceae bacterium]|tara:strand:+ start:223 stop:804 length:582 start_codon:yes stop_codon:yes gene_type:complete